MKTGFRKKKGPHGILFLFEFKYRDKWDDASPEFGWRTWAYDVSHAEEKFFFNGDEGWEIVKIERVREAS